MNKPKIEPILQISTATLVVLGTLLLGMGQQNWIYPAIALSAAITSVLLVDFKRVFRLTRQTSGYFAAAACVWLLFQIARNVEQSHLLNVANTLILLQSILLFQRKRTRVYRQLIALSLLQVTVAAALNMGAGFGLMLVGYVVAAFIALALFFAYCELASLAPRKSRGEARQLPELDPAVGSFEWHASADAAGFVFTQSFLGRIAWMIFLSVLGTVVLFFAIPRFSNRVWRSPQSDQVVTVGFTEEVQLDDIGSILENTEQVMRVEFTELNGAAYSIPDEPYFRGTVLSDYTPGRGRWRPHRFSQARKPLNRMEAPDLSGVVVQTITLQPSSHSVLFNVAPSYSLPYRPSPLVINSHTRQLTVENDQASSKEPFRYELGTTAFSNGQQTKWLPRLDPLESAGIATELVSPWSNNVTSDGDEELAGIKDLAGQILADENLASGSSYDRAVALERHFLNSNLYRYSLEMSKTRNREVDPIVDFLNSHRTGHCEYFAAGLALMLRSQGIPARLVVGYRGGEYNGVGGFYTVRQLHAHAWVEAYVPQSEIPAQAIPPQEDRGHGAWLRLDPTPISGIGVQTRRALWLQTATQAFAYFQVLWDDYVLGLNSSRQQQSIYRPLTYAFQVVVYFMFGEDLWQARWGWIKRQSHSIMTGRWITWQSIVLLSILAPLLYVERKKLRAFVHRMLRRFVQRARRSKRTRPGMHIYDRLEKSLSRRGFRREPQQTHREFAVAVGGQLAEGANSVHVAGVPRHIADAFYRVRFGGQSLEIDELARLERSLIELEKAMALG